MQLSGTTLGLLVLSFVKSATCTPPSTFTISNITIFLHQNFHHDCIQLFRPSNPSEAEWQLLHRVHAELSKVIYRTTIGIYSFEQYIKRRQTVMLKTSCYLATKVMLYGPRTRDEFALLTQKINPSRTLWVLFAVSYEEVKDFLQPANLPFDIELIAAIVESKDSVVFQEAYRVRHDYPLRLKYYGQWTRDEGASVTPEMLWVRRFDLEGITLKTGSIENWPATTFKSRNQSNPVLDGYFARVWRQLETLMNTSSINLRPADGSTGNILANGSWGGLIGMALKDEIDVIVSEMTIDKSRSRFLDFTHPLLISSYNIYSRRLGNNLEWGAVFRPFSQGIWLAIVIWVLAGTVGISFCYYFSLLYGFEEDLEQVFTPTHSFFFILQSLSQQGHYVVPRSVALRILFFTAYLVSAILIPSYSASLISSLTHQSPYRPFDSLEEMVADGKYKLLVHHSTAEYAYFATSKNKLLLEVHEKLIKTVPSTLRMRNSAHALHTVCTEPNYAVFGVEAIWNIRMATVMIPSCPVMSLSKPVSAAHLSLALKLHHPYSRLINHQLRRLMDSGLMKRIEHASWPQAQPSITAPWAQVEPDEVFQVFVFLLSCFALSVTLLFFENLFYSSKNQPPAPVVQPASPPPRPPAVVHKVVANRNWFYNINVLALQNK